MMWRNSGNWNDEDCSNPRYDGNYICKKPKIPLNNNEVDPDNELCPQGWRGYGQKCYKTFNDPKYWGDAKKQCKGQGATLATIHSDDENSFIHSLIAEETIDTHDYWIGLYADRADKTSGDPGVEFFWDSGEVVDYTDAWMEGEPAITDRCAFPFLFRGDEKFECINQGTPSILLSLATGEPGYWCGTDYDSRKWIPCDTTGNYKLSCSLMLKENGKWHDPLDGEDASARGCYEYQNYICEKMKEGATRPAPTDPPVVDEPCEESRGWYGWDGSKKCYKFDFASQDSKDTVMDFELADSTCQKYTDDTSAHLVSIHKQGDSDNLAQLILKQSDFRSFWIGLREPEGESGYGWTDGTPLNYLNWASGEPNDHNGMEKCAELKVGDTGLSWWNDNFCWATNHFICAVDRGTKVNDIEPPKPPEIPTDSQCGNNFDGQLAEQDYYSFDGKQCTGVFKIPYTAKNGENFCQTLDGTGHLASIHSQGSLLD